MESKRVIAFDSLEWSKSGDVEDNSKFYKEAEIIAERFDNDAGFLVDLRFSDGRISKGHFKCGLKFINSAHSFTEGADVESSPPSPSREEVWQTPDELAIVKQIWRRAYLDSEESHVKILKEYADVMNKYYWNDGIETAINTVLFFVGNRGEGKEVIEELEKLKK